MNFAYLKLILILMLNIHHFVIMAQPESSFNSWRNVGKYQEIRLGFNPLVTYDRVIDASMTDWCAKTCLPKRYMGINHIPSQDFNIYLAFNHAVTPKISTSFEVSLNYAGVMNIKGLFLLRKRNQ